MQGCKDTNRRLEFMGRHGDEILMVYIRETTTNRVQIVKEPELTTQQRIVTAKVKDVK